MRSGHLCDYLENIAAQFPDRLAAMDPDGSTGIPKGGMLTHRNANKMPYQALTRSFQPMEQAWAE
jgi:hypothetical protein